MSVKFPLPEDHRFGMGLHPLVHDGTANIQESMWLRLWQARVTQMFPDERLIPSGKVDKATQRIAIALQNAAGLPEDGFVNEETWYLAWE